MLVLTRKFGQAILIGSDIKVTILRPVNDRVRVGIDAPPHVKILREEIADAPSPAASLEPAAAE